MFLGLVFSWWELHTGAAVVLLYRLWPWQGQCPAVPGGVAALQGTVPSGGHLTEPQPLTWDDFTGCLHLCNTGEQGKKARVSFSCCFLLFFSCQISLSLCFLGVTCVLQHKQDSSRERLVYSRDSVKCLKEEFSSKKRDGP